MPVNNRLLRNLQGDSLTLKYLQTMPAKVTNILTDEVEANEQETHRFNSDPTFPLFEEDLRLDLSISR